MLLELLVKATLLLGVAAAFSVGSRGRATAALRHAVWVSALLAAVLVPALWAALPALRVPLLPVHLRASSTGLASAGVASADLQASSTDAMASAAPAASDGDQPLERPGTASDDGHATPAAMRPSAHPDGAATAIDPRAVLDALPDGLLRTSTLLVVWLAGALALALRVLMARVSVARLTRSRLPGRAPWLPAARRLARAMRVPRRLRFLRSDRVGMPMACGVLRPAIVLPAEADTWTSSRLHAVLLHELAHVRRRDCLTQAASDMALAVLWFHPLAWMARRAIRRERERACDDLVLAAGTPAPEYASHLLDVARHARQRSAPFTLAGGVAMASPSELEGRLMAILDDTRPRRALTRRAGMLVAGLTLGVVMPLSALDLRHAPAANPRAVLASPTDRPRPVPGVAAELVRPSAPSAPEGLPGSPVAPWAIVEVTPAAAAQPGQPEPMPTPTPTPSPAAAPVVVATPSVVALAAPVLAGTPMPAPLPDVPSLAWVAPAPPALAVASAQAPASAPAAPQPVVAPSPKPAPGITTDLPGKPAKARRAPADPRVVAALTEALKDSDVEVRRQALHTLARFRDPSTVEALLTALAQPDAEMRLQAVLALGHIRDPRAQKALTGLVNDQDVQVRRQALFALARLRDPIVLEPLTAALQDADPDVRVQAVHGLGQLRDARAVPALTAAARDSHREVRAHAIHALGQLRTVEAVPVLTAALKDADVEIRKRAAFALAQVRDPRAVDGLMAAARDQDSDVRTQAFFALGQVGDARAQELAIAGLKDSDAQVRRMAAFALARIAERND